MKSYETFVMTLYEGIRKDASIRWPDIGISMEKDLSYLRSAFEHRGLAFFTLTLPDYGQWIDESLDHGALLGTDVIPRGIKFVQGRPGLFRGVLAKVFDTDGMLRPDADHEAVLYLRTLCQSLKKLEVPVKTPALKKTVKEFFDVESHLPQSHPDTWDSDIPIWKSRSGHPLWGSRVSGSEEQPDLFGCVPDRYSDPPWDTLRELSRRVTSELGIPNWNLLRPKHGPGAVSEKGWISKYEFPTWPRKLANWFPFDFYATGDFNPGTYPLEVEPPSRLIAVPKTYKGPRLICAEPLAHQWMQQGIWRWLRDRVPKTTLGRSISFEDQTRSQKWALTASHDGSKATLDLSAASDRLSTRLVEYLFQGSELLDGIHACRTRFMEQTLDGTLPKYTVLRKFATMGSALTFPMQSIVFTILAVWAVRLYYGRENKFTAIDPKSGRKRDVWKDDFDLVRVFGDDIIVPTEAYRLTKFVLHECGLLVNIRKSFGGVSFRESCGMDAFDGVDVTPARHKLPYDGSASSTAALIEYSNNLFRKGFWYTADEVLRFIPTKIRKLIVVNGPEDGGLGLISFSGNDFHTRKRMWDPDLQRDYIWRIAFGTRIRKVQGRGRSSLTQFFTEDPAGARDRNSDFLLWESGRTTTSRLSMRRVRVYL